MAIQISPYLTFNGKCREAMKFYQECFGGELFLQTVAETPIASQCPTGMLSHIMHSMLKKDNFILMATDMTRSERLKAGGDVALSLNFDNEQEINRCYSTLATDGKVIDPLEVKSWGSFFGVVQDKYDKVWMLNYDKNGNN